MKTIKYVIGLSLLLGMSACSDDAAGFDIAVSNDMFTFQAVEGGANLIYKLDDSRVSKIKVEYKDEFGESVYKIGDFANTSILLDGFNTPQQNVPAVISLIDHKGNESERKNVSFNTLASNLNNFFDGVTVSPYWEGFMLTYELSGVTYGSATVSFIGENPTTHLRDTLTIENFQLENGRFTKSYSIEESQRQNDYTVVITTEDNKQRVAKKQVWEGIVGIKRAELSNRDFILLDPFHKSKEVAYTTTNSFKPGAFSWKYLFDGDIKGTRSAEYFTLGKATPPFSFMAGPEAIKTDNNDVYFVLDVRKPAQLGEMRFYRKLVDGFATNQDYGPNSNTWETRTPCSIKVYAWTASTPYDVNMDQSAIPASNWKLMGSFSQVSNVTQKERWYYATDISSRITTIADMNSREPVYLSIPFEFDTNEYQYYKIEFLDTYFDINNLAMNYNNDMDVTFHELEVYAKSN